MNLNTIKIDQLSDSDIKLENAFVEIPFLYTPVLKELKRKERDIQKLEITINETLNKREEVLLSFLRLFGIPLNLIINGNYILFNYAEKTVAFTFVIRGGSFFGTCEISGSKLVFSENASFIRVLVQEETEAVLVLPEGDGNYYISLDKSESEKENRLSLIAPPRKLRNSYLWLMDALNE